MNRNVNCKISRVIIGNTKHNKLKKDKKILQVLCYKQTIGNDTKQVIIMSTKKKLKGLPKENLKGSN